MVNLSWIQRSGLNHENFLAAYNYLRDTKPMTIAYRTAIYGAYVNMYLNANFAHDYLLDLMAALCGPFDFENVSKDRDIIKMLMDTEFGYSSPLEGWIKPVERWIMTHCGEECVEDFYRILHLLDTGIGDEILEQYNRIVVEMHPDEYCYFPEMSMGRDPNAPKWPRV